MAPSADITARTILSHRVWVVALLLTVTVVAGVLATRVSFDSAIEIWFLENDPDLAVYDDFVQEFSADEIVVIGVFAADVFTPEILEAVERVTQAASDAPYAGRVLSLATLEPIEEEITGDTELFRERVLANSLLAGSFVSMDSTATAIVVELERAGNTVVGKNALVQSLRETLRREAQLGAATFHMTGTPVLDVTALEYNSRDLAEILPVMVLLLVGVAWLVFRRLLLALLPLGVVLLASTWAYGLMGFLGMKATLISTALMPLFFAVGVADSIHLAVEYQRQIGLGAHREEAIRLVLARLLRPFFFTSATTAAGLLSLALSDLRPVREFGLIAAAGVMAAFVATVGLLPAVIVMIRIPGRRIVMGRDGGFPSRVLQHIITPSRWATRAVAIVSAAGFTVGIAAATQLQVGVDPMSWFPRGDEFRLETERIDAALPGSSSLEFLVTAPDGGLRDPRQLKRLDEFERWLERETAVTRVVSMVDVVKEAARVARHDEVGAAWLPVTPIVTDEILAALEYRGNLEGWARDDYSLARLSARLPLSEAAQLVDQLDRIAAEVDARFPGSTLHVETTGYAKLMVKMEEYLIGSQIECLVLALAVITLLMSVLLRSVVLGLFSMIPNLTPIAIGLGAMSLAGVSLNPGTVMIGAVALGIVVDDTVHFMVALQRALADEASVDEAIRVAVSEVGPALAVTTLLLAASFCVLILGSFAPSIQFGAITTLIVVVALAADLVLLPAVLRLVPWALKGLRDR